MCSDSYPIPILSVFFLYHPYIPHFLIQRFFLFSSIGIGYDIYFHNFVEMIIMNSIGVNISSKNYTSYF